MDNKNQIFNQEDEPLIETYRNESAVDVVIGNIKNLLMNGKLLPGDKLPAEQELCNRMSISRGSLREAMKILSAFGIVDIKRGNGTYISKTNNKVQFDPLLFTLIKSHADIKKYSEFRGLMESAIVQLVIRNANDEDIINIRQEYEKNEKDLKTGLADPQVLARHDISFHAALGHATKNILVEIIYNFVMEFFTPSVQQTHINDVTGQDALMIHKKLLDALFERNLEKAIAAVEESISIWEKLNV